MDRSGGQPGDGLGVDEALDGNVAVTGEIDLSRGSEFTLGLAFGDTEHRAVATLVQSLVTPFDDSLARFVRSGAGRRNVTRSHRTWKSHRTALVERSVTCAGP